MGMDAKQFGVDFLETSKFANWAKSDTIIEVVVDRNMLNKIGDFTHVDPFLFKSGTITINSNVIDDFNSIIKEIIYHSLK